MDLSVFFPDQVQNLIRITFLNSIINIEKAFQVKTFQISIFLPRKLAVKTKIKSGRKEGDVDLAVGFPELIGFK